MSLLYGGTFFTANAFNSATSIIEDLPPGHTTDSFAKSATVTAVNMSLSLYKDAHFARIYGHPAAGVLPLVSYLPFMLRDCITIYACFALPMKIAPFLFESLGSDKSRLTIAQLAAPIFSQVVATPLHLLALDLHARSGRVSMRERARAIVRLWPVTAFVRGCRVVPAYGLGILVNNGVREALADRLT